MMTNKVSTDQASLKSKTVSLDTNFRLLACTLSD